ncbi:RDD family protein [Nocardia sp. NPDC051030]|uniref:RDD family protein n=1 Tax=Nocardia sp. NPDC051030 TaxID=3155162 RepID=UPI0034412D19
MRPPHRHTVVLPSGRFEAASPRARLGARLLDTLIVGTPVGIAAAFILTDAAREPGRTASDRGAEALVLIALLAFAVSAAYEIGLTATQGATFGKRVVGIHVVDADTAAAPGSGIGYGAAWTRWAVLFLPTLVCELWTPLCALSVYLGGPARQGWHDRAAKTYVITDR